MKDVEPILMRFREVEVRIMLLEVRLAEQEHAIRNFRARGGPLPAAAIDDRRMLTEALATLRNRRRVLLSELNPSAPPETPEDPPWLDEQRDGD